MKIWKVIVIVILILTVSIFFMVKRDKDFLQFLFNKDIKITEIESFSDKSGEYYFGKFVIESFNELNFDTIEKLPLNYFSNSNKRMIHKWERVGIRNDKVIDCELINAQIYLKETLLNIKDKKLIKEIIYELRNKNNYFCYFRTHPYTDLFILNKKNKLIYRIDRNIIGFAECVDSRDNGNIN